MKQYLVSYKNTDGAKFHSLKTWPEIQKMLRIMEEVGGEVRIYRLDKIDPERVWPVRAKDTYMLYDLFRNIVEG